MSFQSDLDKLMEDTVSALETGKSAYSEISPKYLIYHGWQPDSGPDDWYLEGLNIHFSLEDAVHITRAIVKARGSLI